MMKQRNILLATLLLFFAIITMHSEDVTFSDSTNTEEIQTFVRTFRQKLQSGNKNDFIALISDEVDVCKPGVVATNSPPLSRSVFKKEFFEEPSLLGISYYAGLMYSDEFTQREFGRKAYIPQYFSLFINRDHIFRAEDGDYNIYVYYQNRDLSTIEFVVKENKIIRICNNFLCAFTENDFSSDEVNYYSYANPTNLYDKPDGKIIYRIPRNIKLYRQEDGLFKVNDTIGFVRLQELGIVRNVQSE
jgi:hypothetical protein